MWLREDGTPYYVGKGHGNRAFRKGSPSNERIIVQDFESEKDAFAAEILLIALYGRKDLGTGNLINRTEGGVGGTTMSPQTLKMLSRLYKSRGIKPPSRLGQHHKLSNATKQAISIAKKGKSTRGTGWKHSPATIQKMCKAAQNRVERAKQ